MAPAWSSGRYHSLPNKSPEVQLTLKNKMDGGSIYTEASCYFYFAGPDQMICKEVKMKLILIC